MTKTGTITSELDNRLWRTFSEFWPAWIKHVDRFEHRDGESISVFFKEDGYITNGAVYIFGKKKKTGWFLNLIEGPVELRVAEGGTF